MGDPEVDSAIAAAWRAALAAGCTCTPQITLAWSAERVFVATTSHAPGCRSLETVK